MIQVIAILFIIAVVLLFIHYIIFEGDSVEGAKTAAAGCSFVGLVVLGWIALAALIILVILAALGAFNH